jgi:hypothetical protein
MPNEILRFEGSFAVWSYTIGHGRLLIRRTKSSAHPHRIDILFKDSGWICLPSSLDDLTIQEVPIDDAAELFAKAGRVRTNDRKMFKVTGMGQQGYVLAGAVTWAEDEGEYNDPSSLIE